MLQYEGWRKKEKEGKDISPKERSKLIAGKVDCLENTLNIKIQVICVNTTKEISILQIT